MRGRASFNPSISKNLFSSVYIHRIRDHSNLSPFEKKRTLVTIPRHPHYFIRSIKRRRNFQFPNTNKDPTFLRWIPSIFSFKNSHNIVKKIKRIIINYIIRGKIEKSFNRWLEGRVRKGEINANSRRVGKLARFDFKYLLPWGSIEINIAIR